MRWTTKPFDWKWRFAVIPVHINNGDKSSWIWLEWYQVRDAGLWLEVRLKKDCAP